jgi:hypothetical protein
VGMSRGVSGPGPHLGTFTAATPGGTPGMEWVEVRDTAQHPAGLRTPHRDDPASVHAAGLGEWGVENVLEQHLSNRKIT